MGLKMPWILLLSTVLAPTLGARRECKKSTMGFDYMGTISKTRTGLPCQPWSSQIPHAHNYTEAYMFPDATVEDAANYCRDPDGPYNWIGPWCLTNDPDIRYQFCDVPECSDYPECRLTESGTDYHGHIDLSSSGRKCVQWPSGEGEKNYCRNPDGRDSLYCYVGTNETEPCSVPFCKPSMHCKNTASGATFSGPLSLTHNGRKCQRWVDQYPHKHNYTDASRFPDKTLQDAENFCRNPDGSPEGPWCYTTDPDVQREPCHLDLCTDCRISDTGREYSGVKCTSKSGLPCQHWTKQAESYSVLKDDTRYPDVDVSAAKNYCRNPDNSLDGPWCYTSDKQKESCDIPMCTEKSKDHIRTPIAKHVIHIGVDGLRPDCINNPLGSPNMLKRMASEGTHTLTRARTCLQTISAPGWSSSLCGVDNEASGILNNNWLPPWRGHKQPITPVTGNTTPLPCLFGELKAQDPNIRTSSFYSWPWFSHVSNFGYPGAVDKEMRMPEAYVITDEILLWNVRSYLRTLFKSSTERSYTFYYIGNVDSFGHTFSWCNLIYNISVHQADRQIGRVLDLIEELGMEEDTLVIVNADHGGDGYTHGRYIDADLHIPMFIKGPGIKKGHQFQKDVYNMDIAPTVAYALGLKPNPYWVGRVMEDAFEK